MTEQSQVRYGGTTIAFQITRTARRKKTVALTIDGDSGLLVAAPIEVPLDEIQAIVRLRAPWILRKATPSMLQAHPRRFVSGESILYLGRRVRMMVLEADVPSATIRFRHWSLEVTVPDGLDPGGRALAIKRAFVRWYKARAQTRLTARIQHWAIALGQQPAEILIRDQRQRWASCSPDGVLRFNWRVVMAEPSLLDYVVVHELVHLAVKNHSAQFWARVAAAIPDYAVRRRRLRELGPYLTL